MPTALIEAPASTDTHDITVLGAIDAYDAVLNDDYAFVAYKETDRGGGWRVRIKARHMTGVVFEPEAMRLSARAAGAQGKPYFTWGNGIDPSAGDPRLVQYRVHVRDGKPSSIEIVVQMRKADHTADGARSVSFDWPA
ncbi:MAG: hypothetical protein JSR77_12090 [Planctomycetes bacterium]|nr:hypothetical protein [Planctomycetota bacterium]